MHHLVQAAFPWLTGDEQIRGWVVRCNARIITEYRSVPTRIAASNRRLGEPAGGSVQTPQIDQFLASPFMPEGFAVGFPQEFQFPLFGFPLSSPPPYDLGVAQGAVSGFGFPGNLAGCESELVMEPASVPERAPMQPERQGRAKRARSPTRPEPYSEAIETDEYSSDVPQVSARVVVPVHMASAERGEMRPYRQAFDE
jgi:hypothetical protein